MCCLEYSTMSCLTLCCVSLSALLHLQSRLFFVSFDFCFQLQTLHLRCWCLSICPSLSAFRLAKTRTFACIGPALWNQLPPLTYSCLLTGGPSASFRCLKTSFFSLGLSHWERL